MAADDTNETGAEAPARFVRQFALTRGRAASDRFLAVDTLLETVTGVAPSRALDPEQRQILDLAESTISVAEIAAHLGVHLGIARVLINDLVDSELLRVGEIHDLDNGPDLASLEMLLNDLINY